MARDGIRAGRGDFPSTPARQTDKPGSPGGYSSYARRGEAARAGELVEATLGAMAFSSNGTARAGYAWNLVCGDSGRRHTMGLFLQQLPDDAPVLHVYLDSSALIQDFQTDHLLWEGLLRQAGLPVSAVKFKLSRKTGAERDRARAWGSPQKPQKPSMDDCPPLDEAERAYVDRCCAGLEGAVAVSLRRAMEAGLRRAKQEGR